MLAIILKQSRMLHLLLLGIIIFEHLEGMAQLYGNERSDDLDLSSLSSAGIHVLPVDKRVKALGFELESLQDRREFTLSDFRNKVVVINFWATWCAPCRAEMPSIESLHQKLKSQGLVWLAVNSGEDRVTVGNYIKKYKYAFPVLLDPNGLNTYQYGVQGLPATLIVNKSGYIVALAVGSIDWRNDNVAAALEKLLAE